MKKLLSVFGLLLSALVVPVQAQQTFLPVVPQVIQSAHNNVGGATVKLLTTTIASTRRGDGLVVAVGAGEVANGSTIILTITDTNSDTCNLVTTQASSTTFAASIYFCPNITSGNTGVTATFSGASSANTTIAMQAWETFGLIPSVAAEDASATGTATSTTLLAGQMFNDTPNQYGFAAFGVGTAAQTVTLTGTPASWVNDSGQINPASASGLFSFVGASQFFPEIEAVSAGGTITSEPWIAVFSIFQPYALPVQESPTHPITTSDYVTPVCTAAMTGTTSTVTVAAPTAGLHLYITSIIATNSHASVDTFVTFQDGSVGTTIWEGLAVHAGGGFVQTFPIPLRVPTVGNGLYVADVTTGANVIVCATGYSGP
jgi:hypothetical protein